MTRGAFITFEGTEGVGKSSCLPIVRALLEKHGYPVLATREPGGTELGERVREWILGGDHGALAPQVETLLMFAARADHLERVIRPALARGEWVLCDRFSDATAAYQGGGRGISAATIDWLRQAVHGDLEPDLTLLLDAPLEVARARIEHRKADHFERENTQFFERVRSRYLELAREDPGRVRLLDASANQHEVQAQIEQIVLQFIQNFARQVAHD